MQGSGLKCFGEVKSGLLHVNGCGNEYWIKKLGGSDIAHHHLSPTMSHLTENMVLIMEILAIHLVYWY